jgi:hypothetical protein
VFFILKLIIKNRFFLDKREPKRAEAPIQHTASKIQISAEARMLVRESAHMP